ncbi:uncharacterized protein E6C27_scaffold477G00590 [Cucumis melo var. makuwa]|uniref:Ty3/gypsy retrotransposon protein n=1 Tax=Cucumis melo var. makuwa TaxID=1194695 RepID=A0A5A7TI54_CUCMM|nr:uncharacterized protein E6C27_scaffold477G00590 [Cucumis melo var. makuwa]
MKEQRELRMFVVVNETEEYEIIQESEPERKELTRLEVKGDNTAYVELSINSMVGLNDPGTMKVRGKMQEEDVIILIDCGATHNFVSEKLVKKLQLPTKETAHYGDFLPLELGGVDVILGMRWLYSIRVTVVDWKNLTLSFSSNGKQVCINGDPSLTKARVSLKSMIKSWGEQDEGFFIECRALEVEGLIRTKCCKADVIPEVVSPVLSVLDQFMDVFEWPDKLPPKRDIEHHIHLKEGTDPINVRPYRYCYHQKEEMEKLVREMLSSGVIQPSTSPFSSLVLLVKKKDGSWCFYVDYRAVNNSTIPNKFPIPVVEELFDELCGASLISKIDLKSGYHHIQMADEDIENTAFRTHEGHYEFLVMPFGLINAPTTFQALMNAIFKPHLRKKKCSFAQPKVEYLGHVISGEGAEVDLEKIKSIAEWPKPTNIREVRGLLGLTGYYRWFVQGYGSIAAPLTQLLKKGGFKWNEEAEEAFGKLKQAMMSLPVLTLPNFNQPFEIETNASGYGVGAVLIQSKRPIAYYSHTLAMRDRARPVYKRELMAVVLARVIQPQYQKWIAKLLGYSFEVIYKLGLENKVADALSRKPSDVQLCGISVPLMVDLKTIKEEVENDPKLQKVIIDLNELREQKEGKYSIQNVVGVHSGFLRTYKRLASELYGEGMKTDEQKHCEECLKCQRNKTLALSPVGLLVPLDIPQSIWSDISIDFVDGLPKANEYELKERDIDLRALREHLCLAQEQMKKYADCKRRDVEFCKLVREHTNVQPTIQYVNENYEWKANPKEVRRTRLGSGKY